jgi:protein-L-isoaspartate(D-aspartate) O-methyltransferase
MDQHHAHFNMVEQQIRTWQVLDEHILNTLKTLERDLFVPEQYKALAYSELELPIGMGEVMLEPKTQARLVHDLAAKSHETILEVGSGTGYLTALLALQSQEVVSLEIHADLAKKSRHNLRKAGISNAEVLNLDASKTLNLDTQFDAILLTGSCDHAPQHLLNCLKMGGRLMGIFGQDPVLQTCVITRTSADEWSSKILWDAGCPRLHGFKEASKFKF